MLLLCTAPRCAWWTHVYNNATANAARREHETPPGHVVVVPDPAKWYYPTYAEETSHADP